MSPTRMRNRLRPTWQHSNRWNEEDWGEPAALPKTSPIDVSHMIMKTTTVEQRLRFFLLVVAGCMCAGTIVELLLAEHTETPVQLIPFVLCGVGLVVVTAMLLRPRRATLIALRLVMGLLIFGSLFGVYEHIEHNLAFELEIRPSATAGDVWLDALKG